jgi:hypothetical protein
MPTADQITDLTPTVTIADNAVRDTMRRVGVDLTSVSMPIARDVLIALIGHDDKPGPLDRYELRTVVIPSTGNAVIVWHCPRADHANGGDGHVGLIARNVDCDQTGLTLGEILGAVLEHERDEHDAPAI